MEIRDQLASEDLLEHKDLKVPSAFQDQPAWPVHQDPKVHLV